MIISCSRCNRLVDAGARGPGESVQCSCGMTTLVPEGPIAAIKMDCPSCGAPVDPNQKCCNFCSTKLGTVICPGCFGAVFEGAKHCSHCGEALQDRIIIHGKATEHRCPRCQSQLRVEVIAGNPLERCPQCEGLWIDRDTVEKIYKDRERSQALTKMTKGKSSPPQRSKLVPQPEGYIKCPECGQVMNRQNFGRFSGVIIDSCKAHGSWFDAEELRKILEFIATGGLEKAAEREKMEIQDEIRWLRRKRAMTKSSDAGAGLGEFGLGWGSGGRFTAESAALGFVGRLLKKLFE